MGFEKFFEVYEKVKVSKMRINLLLKFTLNTKEVMIIFIGY
jgi:hypothetical protein